MNYVLRMVLKRYVLRTALKHSNWPTFVPGSLTCQKTIFARHVNW